MVMRAVAFDPRVAPWPRIELAELPASADGTGRLTLQFRLTSSGPAELDALREARRGMIREEWTRGLEEGEPSLSEAEFSNSWVFWEVPAGEQARCREKLAALLARANRLLDAATNRPL